MNNTEIFLQWLTDNNKTLPIPTSEKVPEDREAEYLAIVALADEFNNANVREYTEYRLGELSLNALFGPMAAESILEGLELVGQQNNALLRLTKHMGVGGTGVDIGNEYATALLDQLQALNIFTQEQRSAIDNKRTKRVTINYSDAWNTIHAR